MGNQFQTLGSGSITKSKSDNGSSKSAYSKSRSDSASSMKPKSKLGWPKRLGPLRMDLASDAEGG